MLRHFDISSGMRVAELHAGAGHFTKLIEHAVGPYGNVHSFQYDERQDSELLSELADRVIIINIPFATNHHSIFSKAYNLLRSQGKIVLIEKNGGAISSEQATDLAGIAGFIREKHFRAGDLHYGLVFKKS